MLLKSPYLLFLGDATDPFAIKLARGVVDWRPELALGECVLPECQITTGLTQLSVQEAKAKGAQSLVLGLANSGGTIQENWLPVIKEAIQAGLDIISGMHQALNANAELAELASIHNVQLHDIRHPTQVFNTGTGEPRSGKRLLAVGTDCSAGKMYTTLAIQRELHKHRDCTFRAYSSQARVLQLIALSQILFPVLSKRSVRRMILNIGTSLKDRALSFILPLQA